MIPNPIKWFELELKRILMRILLDTERDKRAKKKREPNSRINKSLRKWNC